jgi:hypothetical protein
VGGAVSVLVHHNGCSCDDLVVDEKDDVEKNGLAAVFQDATLDIYHL